MQLWIGLFEIRTTELSKKDLNGAVGAFVNALAYAESADHFEKTVAAELQKMHMQLQESDSMEEFEKRIQQYRVAEDLLEISKRIKMGEVQFGKFHSWKEEQEGSDDTLPG